MTTRCHSLSLVVIRCATCLSFYQRSETIVLRKVVVRSKEIEINYNFNLIKLIMAQF